MRSPFSPAGVGRREAGPPPTAADRPSASVGEVEILASFVNSGSSSLIGGIASAMLEAMVACLGFGYAVAAMAGPPYSSAHGRGLSTAP